MASFVYTWDKTSITNSGSDEALLTITALDGNRNVIPNIPINVTPTSGLYTPLVAITDATGSVKGKVGIAGDYSNRIIGVSFTDGNGLTGTANLAVTGASISVQALPASPAPGAAVQIILKATNINGQGVPNATMQLTGTLYAGGTVTTDTNGGATVNITAPAAGSYTLIATGLGVTTTLPVVVVGGGGGAIPNAVGTISGAQLSINPNTISPNTPGSTTSRAALTALFKDAGNLPIQYVRVRFEIVAPSGSIGEQISTGTNTVYSDASGVASADYIAGTTTSPTNGVQVRACYGYTDADIAGGLCPNSVPATLTVAGQALSISLGSNNKLDRANQGLTYVQYLVVTVNDAAGAAVAGAAVSASVDITHYAKGFEYNDPKYIVDTAGLYYPQLLPPTLATQSWAYGQPVPGTPPTTPGGPPTGDGKRVWCANEDYNRNGLLDAALAVGASANVYPTGTEDVNGDGIVNPRKADVTISYVNGQTTTGADGTLLLKIQYPMNVATWLAYTVKVSTAVGGTEGKDEKSFETSFIMGDEINGSFLQPAYGYGRCVDSF